MTDSSQTKPTPARAKPTPARDLNNDAPLGPSEPDYAEERVDIGGKQWTVRVLGRSGRASGASPPLLLLGFWDGEPGGDDRPLEAMVVGRDLDELSHGALEEALASAVTRRDPDRKAAFFAEASQGSRR